MAFGPKGMKVTVVKGYQDFEEMSWHRVAEVRAAKARELVADPLVFYKIAILSLVLEPLRFLTRWFMIEGSKKEATGIPTSRWSSAGALRPASRRDMPSPSSSSVLLGFVVGLWARRASASHPVLEEGLRQL